MIFQIIIRGTAVALLAATVAILPFSIHQYDTANDVPASMIKSHETIRGRVVKVIDGDTIRIQHSPLLLDRYPFITDWKNRLNRNMKCSSTLKSNLSQCTITIRLYGIDAPEMARAGNPGQPYASEAKEYVINKVMPAAADSSTGSNGNDSKKNQIVVVHVKLLGKDQYSRIIGRVTTIIPKRKLFGIITTGREEEDLSVGLIEQGLASLYTGGGAKYDGRRSLLEHKIDTAKQKKMGIWKKRGQFVDPAIYKKEMKYARR